MAKLRIQIIGVIDVDTDVYSAAALEAEAFAEGEVTTDPTDIAGLAVGHFPIEDAIPRWARASVTCVHESYTLLDQAGDLELPKP